LRISSGSLIDAVPRSVKVPFRSWKSFRTFCERLRELNVLTTVISDLPSRRTTCVLSPATRGSPLTARS
jgi:hypothetical protein